tara:strand:- start:425 stop:640 length:216 start_codon:yes stop_codon:yes gene_type:complete
MSERSETTKSEEYVKIAKMFGQLADFAVFHATVTNYIKGEFPTYMDGIPFRMLCDQYRAENLNRLEEEDNG